MLLSRMQDKKTENKILQMKFSKLIVRGVAICCQNFTECILNLLKCWCLKPNKKKSEKLAKKQNKTKILVVVVVNKIFKEWFYDT